MREGQTIPKTLQDRPVLQSFDQEVYSAFSFLSNQRQITGMGPPGAIPLDMIVLYVDEFDAFNDSQERKDFIELVVYVDRAWLSLVHEKVSADNEKNKSVAKSKARR